MTATFSDLGLPPAILDVLASAGIEAPFPIQASAIPDVLAGRDVAGRAPTGSGKTLAFGLPMLATTPQAESQRPTALILTPTRELAAQIRKELAPYGKATRRQVFAIYGGVRYGPQIEWLRRGVDILVATPGRLEDLIEQRAVDLAAVGIVAIDEADRMADMGFLPAVRRILDQTSRDRQTLLFSATLDGDVAVLMRSYQVDPVRHEAEGVEPDLSEALHVFWDVERNEKVRHTASAIRSSGSTIVFTRTRHGADRLARNLHKEGVSAVAMHGGRSQNQRNRALADFSNGAVDALVATDVAARGIHVDDVSTVVHYDPPNGHKDYLHRSGRTARAGASGTVVSLVMRPERRAVNRIKSKLELDVPTVPPQHAAVPTSSRPAKQRSPRTESRTPEGTTGSRPGLSAAKTAKRPAKRRAGGSQPNRPAHHVGVFVSNLPWSATDRDLERMFRRHGTVSSAAVKVDRRGRSKGIGIVTMERSAAHKAITHLSGRSVKGRRIEVRLER